MTKGIWHDLATKGAVLGLLMLVSHIIEQAALTSGAFVWIPLEMLLAAGLFIYLLYRFAKQASRKFAAGDGSFSFSRGLVYVMWLSIFSGIMVGVGGYIYTHFIVGYDKYVTSVDNALSPYIEEIGKTNGAMASQLRQMVEQFVEAPEPTIIATVVGSIFQYALVGVILGLIIGASVKRSPDVFKKSDE